MTENEGGPHQPHLASPDRGPLCLTMGDPAGIGPDITLKAWQQRDPLGVPPFVCYGDPDLLIGRAAALGISAPVTVVDGPSQARDAFAGALPVIPIRLRARAEPGAPDTANAAAVLQSIERAVADVTAARGAAVVTNPIAKSVLYRAGFRHPGHTEYLAALAELHDPATPHRPVMMLASDELKVVPVTIHIPLAEVPDKLTVDLIVETARITAAALRRDFGIDHPRLALSGLNPHAGESGALGREDQDIVAPAIAVLMREGYDASGPHPADTLFHAAARRRYDVAIAMYHDQALIPIKTLAFDSGVNVTLGLPFIRTSPDHGTAFDIAGTGRASPESLVAALRLAHRMAARRAGLAP